MLKASCETSSPLSFLHHGSCTEAEKKQKLRGKYSIMILIIFSSELLIHLTETIRNKTPNFIISSSLFLFYFEVYSIGILDIRLNKYNKSKIESMALF